MNQIMSIFLPAVFGLFINQKTSKQSFSNRDYVIKYFVFVLIINIISYAITIYVFGQPDFIFTNTFTMKYLCLSTIIGVITSLIINFIEENLEINIRVDKK